MAALPQPQQVCAEITPALRVLAVEHDPPTAIEHTVIGEMRSTSYSNPPGWKLDPNRSAVPNFAF